MLSRVSLLLLISCLLQQVLSNKFRAKELGDHNFEHDTQATSGSTTGDWFVNFCDRTKPECKELEPKWHELAASLYGRVTCAIVDK